jgi:hypothetical protein
MALGKVSRRWVVGVLGASALASPLRALASGSAREARPPRGPSRARLLHPLVPGARLARWVVAAIEPLHRGAVRVVLHAQGDDRKRFHLEILARDPSPIAARPPAETRSFAVFVCNGGDGFVPTVEDQGLAAMALGALIARNEGPGDADGFLTHAARIASHPDALLASG